MSIKKAQGGQLSVLIVDDNRYSAEALGKLLEYDGHKVEIAYDGESALHIANASYLDAIVLDIGLPGKNGYEIARVLKQTMQSPAILIALTGYGQEEDKLMAQEAGFDHHLTKPILSREIEELVFTHKANIEKRKMGL